MTRYIVIASGRGVNIHTAPALSIHRTLAEARRWIVASGRIRVATIASQNDGRRPLNADEQIEYALEITGTGRRAANVARTESPQARDASLPTGGAPPGVEPTKGSHHE